MAKKLVAKNEDSPIYQAARKPESDSNYILIRRDEDQVIARALEILESRLYRGNCDSLNSPGAVREYLKVRLCQLDHEEFHVTFLDAQHRTIAHESMFTGTLTQTSVYPREVVKAALRHNAAAVIFSHNHPSGIADPSQSDRMLTDALKQALALVDVRVLDHIIVAGTSMLSFAERGMI